MSRSSRLNRNRSSSSPLTVFNGGEKGGKVKLLIHIFLTVPVPAAVVTDVTITRKGTGIHSVAKVPVVAGGSGSTLDFKFRLGKTYTYKGRKLQNEAHTEGKSASTTLKGGLAVPCTPTG